MSVSIDDDILPITRNTGIDFFEHIKVLFTTNLGVLNPPFPEEFRAILPNVNPKILQKKKAIDDTVIQELALRDRSTVIRYIINNIIYITTSDSQIEHIFMIILQSFTSLYFKDVQSIDIEDLNFYLSSLILTKRIYASGSQLVFRTFYYFFLKVAGSPSAVDFLIHLNMFFEVFHNFPGYFLPANIEFCFSLISLCNEQPKYIENELIYQHFAIILRELQAKSKGKLDEQFVRLIYLTILQILYNTDNIQFTPFNSLILRFAIEISRLTSIVFREFGVIINQIISKRTFTDPNVISLSNPIKRSTEVLIPAYMSINDYKQNLPEEYFPLLQFLAETSEESVPAVLSSMIIDSLGFLKPSLIEILLITFLEPPFRQPPAMEYYETFQSFSIFFNAMLFTPDYSCFQEPLPLIVNLRHISAQVFAQLNYKIKDITMVNTIIPLLINSSPYPYLFVELLYYIRNCFDFNNICNECISEFLVCINSQLQMQLKLKDDSFPFISESRKLMMTSMNDLAKSDKFCNMCVSSQEIIDTICNFLFIETVQRETTVLLSSLLCYSVETNSECNIIYSQLTKILKQITSEAERKLDVGGSILNIFHSSLACAKDEFYITLAKSEYFIAVSQYILSLTTIEKTSFTESRISPVFVTSLLILYSLSIAMMKRILVVNWTPIADVIRKFGVSEEVYSVIIMIVSVNQIEFTGINCIEAGSLILPILESPFRSVFLKDLSRVVSKSYIQCINSVKAGVHKYILDIMKENPPENESMMMIAILTKISSAIFDRSSLFRCIELTDPSKETNKNISTILSFISGSVNETSSSVTNFLQFTAQLGSVKLPNLNVRDFLGQVTVSSNVLLTDFDKTSDTMHFINFCSINNFLSFVFDMNNVYIYSNVFPTKIISSQIKQLPMNKWFNITISFDYLSTFNIYIDGEQCAKLETSCNRWDEYLDKIVMFHPISHLNKAMNSNVNGQVSRIYVFLTNANDKILENCSKINCNFIDILSLPKLVQMFSPEYSQNNAMMNLADLDSQPAIFTMYSFIDVCPLKNIFIGSKGICLILSHFSRIDYEKENSGYIFECLLKAISEFINCSPEIEKQMVRCNACQIISYFMYKLKIEYLTPRLRGFLMNMERNIKTKELLNSFYQHIIIEFSNWFLLDESTIYYILKIWNDISVNHIDLFTECVSFTYIFERCYYLIENSKFGPEVTNEMLNLVIISAKQTCNMQTIGLLIKLLQFPTGNSEFSLRLLHIISTLSIEVPEMQEDIQKIMIYMKEKIFHHKPILFVTIIELFANSDALFVDCVLNTLNMCIDNDLEYINDMMKTFCNELVAANDESIEDLSKRERYRGMSCILLPFVFVISFYIESDVLYHVKNFLHNLFSQTDKVKIVSKSLTTLGLLFALLYTIVIDNDFLACLVSIFQYNTQLLADAIEAIDIISLYSNKDCHSIQNTLASALVFIVMERRDNKEINDFINIVFTFLIYGHQRSCFEKHENSELERKNFDLLQFVETFRLGLYNKRQSSFGLYFSDNTWNDLNIAVLLVPLIDFVDANSTTTAKQLILLMTFMLRQDIEYAQQVIPFLNIIAERTDISVQDLNPLFLVICKNIDLFKPATVFFGKYEQAITQNVEVYMNSTNAMMNLIQQLKPSSNVEDVLVKLFSSNFEAPVINDYTLNESIEMIRKGLKARKGNLERKWRLFWEMLIEDRTPYFNPPTAKQYVRSDRYDAHFRPIIFKKLRKQTKIDNGKVEKSLTPEIDFLITEKDPKFIGSIPHELWSAPCQKISVSKRTDGIIYITPTKIIFQDENKSLEISGESVECLFWHWTYHIADAITIFTHDYKGFIFRFPNEKNHDFVKQFKKVTMPNCFFFQEHPPYIEIDRLCLTQRWKNHSISNYDYLTWLNMLSGRSFLDVTNYPIFPWLLINETKETSTRDLTHNIAYMNKNLFAYRRKIQQESFDPADLTLFSSTFSNSLLVVHYNLRVEPFTTLFQQMKFEDDNEHFVSINKELSEILERKSDMKIDELTPEFFFSPEFLKEGAGLKLVQLPQIAKSAEHYVYLNRKSLESENVSKRLNRWIDHIWGFKQRGSSASMAMNMTDYRLYDTVRDENELEQIDEKTIRNLLCLKGSVPRMLFTGQHPAKPVRKQQQIDAKKRVVSIQNLESSVVALKVCNGTTEKFRIYSIFSTGKMMCLRVGQNTFDVNMPAIAHFMGPAARRTQVAFLEGDGTPSFAFVSYNSPTVRFFDSDSHQYLTPDITPHINPVTSLCSCGKTIISGGQSGEVVQWMCDEYHNFEAIAISLAHDKPITCLNASTKLGIVTALSADGILIILTIPDLRYLRSQQIEISKEAVFKSIIICEEMGYICVFYEHENKTYIENFTVNGSRIGKSSYDGKFKAAISYVSPQFFDIIALATTKKIIFFIDAFSLGILHNQKCQNEITQMAVHQESYSIVAATPENNVFVIQTVF